MHLKRWLTAVIAVPLLIALIGPGPRWLFYLLLFAASSLGLHEFYRMTVPDLPKTVRAAAHAGLFLLFALVSMRQVLLVPALVVLFLLFPMTWYMLTRPSASRAHTAEVNTASAGPVYVGLPLALMVVIDLFPRGNLWIFFLLVGIFATDTGAFYCGRLFGRHKLYEAVSPKKTWEGAVGGLFAGVIGALLFAQITALHRLDPGLVVLAASMSVAGQIGDLAESMLKRNHGIKDSGGILPGHGGILDRIDSILFAVPVLFVYLSV